MAAVKLPCLVCDGTDLLVRSRTRVPINPEALLSVLECRGCGSAVALRPDLAASMSASAASFALLGAWNVRNTPKPELKPCGHCGHAAEIFPDSDGFAVAQCLNSECRANILDQWVGGKEIKGATRERLVTRWNRRT